MYLVYAMPLGLRNTVDNLKSILVAVALLDGQESLRTPMSDTRLRRKFSSLQSRR